MDWSVGIFPMMTIIAALVVTMLAVRFVYMDRRYSEIIGEYKNVIEHTLNKIETNENKDEKKALLQALLETKEEIEMHKNNRKNNASMGLILDIVSIAGIVVTGFIAAAGVFDNNVWNVVITLIPWMVIPTFHFVYHVLVLRREKTLSI